MHSSHQTPGWQEDLSVGRSLLVPRVPTHILIWWKGKDMHHLLWEILLDILQLLHIFIQTMLKRKSWVNGKWSVWPIVYLTLLLSPTVNIRIKLREGCRTSRDVLMQLNNAPEKYRDFAVELASEYLNHIATRKLGWRIPYEFHFGETPNLSVFHFLLYEEIHYMEPNASFPKPNMLPGQFLGIARTARGDAFTFYILLCSCW